MSAIRDRHCRWQRLPIDLSTGQQRQPVQDDKCGRHEVPGDGPGQEGAQFGGVGHGCLPGRRKQHHIAGQERPSVNMRADSDHGPVYRRMAFQSRGHLAGLHSYAADLHLVVQAAEELQFAVGRAAHQVSGAVQPRAGRAVRVSREAPRGQPGTAVVAAGESWAREP
jgi:hypothetical protein